MKFELRPARPADVEAIMQVMADAMANLQHPEWFVPDDAVYMAEHISGPKGFCLVAEEKTTGALAAYFTVKLAGTAPDALGWQLGMSEEELNTTAQMDSCCVAPPYQGNGLEGKLLLMAEDTLRGSRYRHLLATVHPDNAASLYTGLHRGYTIAANHVICYGDKVRDILYKELESRNTNMNTTIRAMTPADKDSVMEMMRDIRSHVKHWDDEDEVRAYLRKMMDGEVFDHKGLIYGMGHAVYSLSDPRERIFRGYVEKLSVAKKRDNEMNLYNTIEKVAPEIIAEKRHIFKGVSPNVDFYSGFVYEMLGIPMELYTPLFAIARIVGWSAHRLEEIVGMNKIIRPAYKSVMKEIE